MCVVGCEIAPTIFGLAQMLKGDIKALEDEKLHLRAELQGAYLDREGDSGKIKGLQVSS